MPDELPVLTTSQRSCFRRCPQRGVWTYFDGLSEDGETPDALWFGIGVHEALAKWYRKGYKRGPHPADTFEQWANGEFREIRASREEWYDAPKYEDAVELGVDMLDGYVEKYGTDPDWFVIAIEQPFRIKVVSHGKPIALFMSTWDGVFRDRRDGLLYLMEHKTAAQISLPYLELDDQGGAYWAVAGAWLRAQGILKPGENIAGIRYNFLRKAMRDDRPQDTNGLALNKDGSVSKRQPPPRYVRHDVERSPGEQKSQMERLAKEVAIINGLRDGSIPVTKNTTKDCPWCPFFDACILHDRGGTAYKELLRSGFTVVDPYSRYTKSAGE